jgi:hypothetical protein
LGWTEHLSGLVVVFLIAVQYLLGTEIALITITSPIIPMTPPNNESSDMIEADLYAKLTFRIRTYLGLHDIGDIVLGWTEHLSGLVGVIFLIAVQYLLGMTPPNNESSDMIEADLYAKLTFRIRTYLTTSEGTRADEAAASAHIANCRQM